MFEGEYVRSLRIAGSLFCQEFLPPLCLGLLLCCLFGFFPLLLFPLSSLGLFPFVVLLGDPLFDLLDTLRLLLLQFLLCDPAPLLKLSST